MLTPKTQSEVISKKEQNHPQFTEDDKNAYGQEVAC